MYSSVTRSQELDLVRACVHQGSCDFLTCDYNDPTDVKCVSWAGILLGEGVMLEQELTWTFNVSCQMTHMAGIVLVLCVAVIN